MNTDYSMTLVLHSHVGSADKHGATLSIVASFSITKM